jgi:cytochrome P450
MSGARLAGVIASYRGGSTYAPPYETFVIVPLIAAMAVACVLISIYLRRRHRQPRPVADQWQALAVMGELCPHGWQARITVYGRGVPVPDDAPPAPVPPVQLEWKQFDAELRQVIVARRAWAPNIGEALQTMVEDRRTDLTLEQIERDAAEQGHVWRNG